MLHRTSKPSASPAARRMAACTDGQAMIVHTWLRWSHVYYGEIECAAERKLRESYTHKSSSHAHSEASNATKPRTATSRVHEYMYITGCCMGHTEPN